MSERTSEWQKGLDPENVEVYLQGLTKKTFRPLTFPEIGILGLVNVIKCAATNTTDDRRTYEVIAYLTGTSLDELAAHRNPPTETPRIKSEITRSQSNAAKWLKIHGRSSAHSEFMQIGDATLSGQPDNTSRLGYGFHVYNILGGTIMDAITMSKIDTDTEPAAIPEVVPVPAQAPPPPPASIPMITYETRTEPIDISLIKSLLPITSDEEAFIQSLSHDERDAMWKSIEDDMRSSIENLALRQKTEAEKLFNALFNALETYSGLSGFGAAKVNGHALDKREIRENLTTIGRIVKNTGRGLDVVYKIREYMNPTTSRS